MPGSDDPAPGAGHWIAQLYSEPESTGSAVRDQRLSAIHATVPGSRDQCTPPAEFPGGRCRHS
ncbi:hypothetical protein [Streptomyces goshikiensis]|uniref:hypothetical protein n=1 Tax=Streptomyces goshikiensis TaxID=1942 RepID=UPI0036A1DFEC